MHLVTTEYEKLLKCRFNWLMICTNKTNISDIARGTGINRKTIERIADLNHKRSIEYEEIDPICEYFHIDKDQLDGTFLKKMTSEIEQHLKNMNLLSALEISQKMMSKSILPKERIESHFYIGESLRRMDRMDDALIHINKGMELSVEEDYKTGIIRCHHQMMNYLFDNGKLQELRTYAQKCLTDKTLAQDKRHLAVVKHYKGIALYFTGHKLDSKRFFAESILLYKEIRSEDLNLARIMATLADLEYFEGNYSNVLSLLEDALAIQITKSDGIENILKTKKDLARCHVKLNNQDTASDLINECIDIFSNYSIDSSKLLGDILVIKLDISKSVELAIEIMQNQIIDLENRKEASDFIMKLFSEGGDIRREVLMLCYEVARK